jgi:hypothetical protein
MSLRFGKSRSFYGTANQGDSRLQTIDFVDIQTIKIPNSNHLPHQEQRVKVLCLHYCKVYEMSETDAGFLAALEEGKKGAAEGGVPIGACLVGKDGDIIGQGHNMRVQKGSATLHVSARTMQWILHLLTDQGRDISIGKLGKTTSQ